MTSKTILITGGGQGIGLAMAFRFAESGASLVIASKDRPDQRQETVEGILARGGKVLACETDVSNADDLQKAVTMGLEEFGGLDVLINNTSYPCFKDIFHTSIEQYDLAMSTSVRATFLLSQFCFPHLKKSQNPHIINIAPPLNLEKEWLKDYLPFSLGKFGMSMCTIGMSSAFYEAGIAVNALWPQTNIATQRLKDYLSPEVYTGSRLPAIIADAAFELASRTCREATGQFFIDEILLREVGIIDFSHYAVDPSQALVQTLFLPLKEGMTPVSKKYFK